ncbi:sensor domain-containing protein [Mycolicibacter sinensis]|uniref:sensor domain-containing protein n=1 Tax=Mycolicibacter sinensis (strain JDM601) TaxID=875328 RepID=UPI000A9897B9|nr:sensor domain-containing protein [Mycolicibacter sinensis]
MKGPKRSRLAIGGVACLAVLSAGFLPTAAADSADPYVPAGKVESLLVPAERIGDIVGVTFEYQKSNRRPFRSDDLGKDSACAMMMGPDVETFGRDFTGYRFRVDRDTAEDADFIVQQRVATYEDSATAAQAFGKTFNKGVLAKCNGSVVAIKGDDTDTQYRLRIQSITPNSARWVKDQLLREEPMGFSCSNVAGVKGNVLYSAKVCQFGNGAPAAATIAERITSQVAGVRA